ncbi:3-oxoacyl-ACP reductase [Paenarthrobacter sp. Z7-10]|nr:3-oxoacyl-ACP reductase [Paenarthrobacter sp. Z7-10]
MAQSPQRDATPTHTALVADSYSRFVNGRLGRGVAGRLGLPRPAVLRRYAPGEALIPGPVLVLGTTPGADALAQVLLEWKLDVRRHAGPKDKLGAIIVVLDDLASPEELSEPIRSAGASLRGLRANARLLTISRPAGAELEPEMAAARQAVDGILRSLAKELRRGATANGIILAEGVTTTDVGTIGAVRFFLSGRSAFVDGQFLCVDSGAGQLPQSWDRPLAGKVAVVTGGARGIGAAIARTLARDGVVVVVVDVPASGDQLAAVANSIRGTALQLDITAAAAGQRILDHALARHGRLDIVVHNAGITRDKLLANMDAARWDAVIAVNLSAQLRMNRDFLGSAALTGPLRIVSVASTSGIAGNRGQTNYAASKAGVIGMVRATAKLLAPLGGSVNAVAPGFIETDMTARMPFATRELARRLNSLQQGGWPEDVAETIAFLASDAAGGISGNVLRVCGQNLVGQ